MAVFNGKGVPRGATTSKRRTLATRNAYQDLQNPHLKVCVSYIMICASSFRYKRD